MSLDEDSDLDELDEALKPQYYLSPSERRSLKQVGAIDTESGGLAPDAFGAEGGEYLTALVRSLEAPLVSRWGSILLRRTLLSKVESPENVKPADWVAERAWRLLRMGEADAARALVLEVDGPNFTPRLYEVTMQAHLAAADPAGICPFVPSGSDVLDAPTWTMFKPICASFSGEQGRATALLNTARRQGAATGIDYLLAEKAVGAGFKGRRAVTIKWDDIDNFNNWRFGLGAAMGVEAPDRLYDIVGDHVQGWRVRAPMLSMESRIKAADTAAAMGVLSSEAMVDLYSAARDDAEAGDDLKSRASILRSAYTARGASGRIDAMRDLWGRGDDAHTGYSMKVLTARAAARIPASEALAEQAAPLIESMLTAGLDRSAVRWLNFVEQGSSAWGLLAVASPDWRGTVDYGAMDDFYDADESEGQLKSKFLLAALAGLGRSDAEAVQEFSDDLEVDLSRTSKWTRAISSAAQRGQQGTVALLANIGMQGRSWNDMSPLHLYHVTRALRQVGLEAEARMIAAEALTRTS